MPNGDQHGPEPTLLELAKRTTDRIKYLETKVQEAATTVLRLQQENDALRTALRAMGVKPPKAKAKKSRP